MISSIVEYAKSKKVSSFQNLNLKKRKIDKSLAVDDELQELKEQLKSCKFLQSIDIDGMLKFDIKDIKDSEKEITASIVCAICKSKIKTYKYKDTTGSWILSNFTRHVKREHSSEQSNSNNKSKFINDFYKVQANTSHQEKTMEDGETTLQSMVDSVISFDYEVSTLNIDTNTKKTVQMEQDNANVVKIANKGN